jgi:hypothetical protein
VGKDSFRVDEVTLDYEGVNQIATAQFSEDGEDYYEGGTVSIEIDTTPGEDGGIVRIQANMEAGNPLGSLQNLVDEINSYIACDPSPARVVLKGSPLLSELTENDGGLPHDGLYVGYWSLTVGTGEDAQTYSGRGEVVTDGEDQSWVNLEGETVFQNLGDFMEYLASKPGINSVTLNEDGDFVIETTQTGADAYVSMSFKVAIDVTNPDGLTLEGSRSDYGSAGELADTLGYATLGEDGVITLVSADRVNHQFSINDVEISTAGINQQSTISYSTDDDDYYAGGTIGVSLNGTVISVDMVEGDAEATLAALRAAIWSQNNNYIGVIDVPNEWTDVSSVGVWSVGVGEDAITSGEDTSLAALLQAIEGQEGVTSVELVNGKIVITGDGAFTLAVSASFGEELVSIGDLYGDFSSVKLNGGTIALTAADAVDGEGEIEIESVHTTLEAKTQITEVDFSDADFALGERDGEDDAAQVSITVGGHVITAETQATHHQTVRAVAQALIEARDGVYQEEVVAAATGDFPAVLAIDLPADVNGESVLIEDGLNHSISDFVVRFGEGAVFSYQAPDYYSLTVLQLVDDMNAQLQQWNLEQEIDEEASGYFSYNAATNQIVITSNAVGEGAEILLIYGLITAFFAYDADPVMLEGEVARLTFSGDVYDGEDQYEITEIELPFAGGNGVTGGSVIRGVDGNFAGAEAALNIQVDFDVAGEDYSFTAPAHLDQDMLLLNFIPYLNELLSDFATAHETGSLGTFYLSGEALVFQPEPNNLGLWGYQVVAFNVSEFAAVVPVTDINGPAPLDIEMEEAFGSSDLLSIDLAMRDITLDDAISMDPMTVEFVIDGETYSGTFLPDLVEKPGGDMPTVGDFISWLEGHFIDQGVTAQIVNGNILFTALDLEGGEVTLKLLDTHQTVTSAAVELTGPEEGVPGTILLTEFAGRDADAKLVGDTIDFQIYVGSATEGEILEFSYVIEDGATLADLIAHINEVGADQSLSAYMTQDGLVLATSGENGIDHLWTSSISVAIEQPRMCAVEGLADILGEVALVGDSIILHGSNTGPDELEVGLSYERIDTDESDRQQIIVEFNNNKLDGVTDGSTVSIEILGVVTSLVVRTIADAAGPDELDLSALGGAVLSVAILEALMERVLEDHPEGTFNEIVRGAYDDESVFHEEAGNSSVVLRLTAGYYGAEALGAAPTISAAIVDAFNAPQFSVISDEIQAGSAFFIDSDDGVEIYDENGESTAAQTGRNELIVTEDPEGVIHVEDITDNIGPVLVTDDEFDLLDIDLVQEGVSPGTSEQAYINPDPTNGYNGDPDQTEAVRQTHQNPDGSYTAVDGSPVTNVDNVSAGNADHYGGSSGYYDQDGLHTDHLDGSTLVEGDDHYDVGQTGSETAATGAYHGEIGLNDSGEDDFLTDVVDEGFAGFTWDHVIKTTTSRANADADVINNFNVDNDVIGFEGAIEDGTAWGDIDYVYAGENFDLDWHEFGLVSSDNSGLNGSDLSNEHLISALLNNAFCMEATAWDDEYFDTSIFAITAQDDPSKTAIWAHTQSSGNDTMIDANELTLLAIVNTIGGEFNADNLLMLNHDWVV